MPDQTQRRDEQQRQQQEQTANQTEKVARTLEQGREAVREFLGPQQAQEIQHKQKQDEASLSQRWPELNEQAEKQLKQEFQEIAEQARGARAAIDNYERQVPGADQNYINDARRLVDEELRGARSDVHEAREHAQNDGGQISADVEQRMNERQEKLSKLQNSVTEDAANAVENTRRQSLLEELQGPELKQALWELNGRELEKRELADFRRKEGLPDEALVFRENDTQMIAAGLSMKKVMDNINKMTADESVDASNAAPRQEEKRRALSSEEQQRLQRQDEAALAQRWPELTEAAENRLKNKFRAVSEHAEQVRQAVAEAAQQADPDSPRLQEMRTQVDEEMRLARRDVVEAREDAPNQGGKVSSDMNERFTKRIDRLEKLEREATEEAGESLRAYLKSAGLEKTADRYRDILEDNVAFHKQELDRAEANKEVSNHHEVAAEKLQVAEQQLRDFEKLLEQNVPSMKPDLVETRIEERKNQDRLRIDMTDFTHRVNSVEHTIKAEIYKEAMQKAFPDADVSMFEYRSPTMNKMVDEKKDFAEKLERALEAREAEIRKRREENLY